MDNFGLLSHEEWWKLKELRQDLYENPEASGNENHTREIIANFLRENTNLDVHLTEDILFAFYDGDGDTTIAIRSDHDAIVGKDGKAYHGCGHDGHTVIAVGTAMVVEKLGIRKNVLYIFQPSEENGRGALKCLHLLGEYDADYVYGLHNFPGYEEGIPILRPGTFMCASSGMEIVFEGVQAHASEPEKGVNPIYAISNLVQDLEPLAGLEGYRDFGFEESAFATIVHASLGSEGAYGVSPAKARVQMTLRANKLEDLAKVQGLIEEKARNLAIAYKLDVNFSYSDEFPDTVNSEDQVDFLENTFNRNGISPIFWDQAFRASEDFGWYLKECPGAFFGIGAGEDALNLHHSDYEFNDNLIMPGIQYFTWIIESR